jgi:transcriptional regulator with XRE-family HTH domain
MWVYCSKSATYNLLVDDIKKLREELGKKIRHYRNTIGLTQEKLGEKANLNYKFIGELERGNVNVSFDSLFKVSQALGINIGDLFVKSDLKILKITVKEKTPFSKLSAKDLGAIKKSLHMLNKAFSKI